MNVNSDNEWDSLREVIAALAQDIRYPRNDLRMDALQASDIEPLTSKWLAMSLLMLSPDLAVVNSH